jgi:hypothetical protein
MRLPSPATMQRPAIRRRYRPGGTAHACDVESMTPRRETWAAAPPIDWIYPRHRERSTASVFPLTIGLPGVWVQHHRTASSGTRGTRSCHWSTSVSRTRIRDGNSYRALPATSDRAGRRQLHIGHADTANARPTPPCSGAYCVDAQPGMAGGPSSAPGRSTHADGPGGLWATFQGDDHNGGMVKDAAAVRYSGIQVRPYTVAKIGDRRPEAEPAVPVTPIAASLANNHRP